MKDLKVAKAKLETDIGIAVIELLSEFETKTGCGVGDIQFDFHQKCEPLKEPVSVITNVKVILDI